MSSYSSTFCSFPHPGKTRPDVPADTLRPELPMEGIAVRYVVNITDLGHGCAG
jgi:cysteinyl-tRNA synthetase